MRFPVARSEALCRLGSELQASGEIIASAPSAFRPLFAAGVPDGTEVDEVVSRLDAALRRRTCTITLDPATGDRINDPAERDRCAGDTDSD